MKIRKLVVRNFRGIKECDWHIPADLICLVGSGDSTKTTLLDAMGLVLSRNYSANFTDADFYNCDTELPISISAAITHLSNSTKRQDEMGHYLCGIFSDGTIVSEPLNGAEACIVVRLTIDRSLEPVWEVVRDGADEAQRMSSRQRQQMGFFRLGEFFETHLRWSRNSALSAMSETNSATSTIVEAYRVARASLFRDPPTQLSEITEKVRAGAQALGSYHLENLRPGLDPSGASTGNALVLHDKDIPLTHFGRGTQRLTSLAIQEQAADGGSIVAIDEIEIGLEPHRLIHLLQHFQNNLTQSEGQVFLTTHSPTAVQALSASYIWIARSCDGHTEVLRVPDPIDEMQGTLRSASPALLSRSVIVGEGATEAGFIRELLIHWDNARIGSGSANSGSLGVAVVDGSGSTVATKAYHLAKLGYRTALFIDNDDQKIDQGVSEAVEIGTELFRCSSGRCLEEEFVMSLNSHGLQEFLHIANDFHSTEAITSRVSARLPCGKKLSGFTGVDWEADHLAFGDVQAAVASAAAGRKHNGIKENGWFKTFEGGRSLGQLLAQYPQGFAQTMFVEQIRNLKDWIYKDLSNND